MSGPNGKGSVLSSIAALASLVAALSCCLPLGTLLMAAGSAGASIFSERLRPFLLVFSVLSLLFGFVETYRRGRCEFRHRVFRTVLLWSSALVVAAMLIFPQFVAGVLAGRFATNINAASSLRPFDLADLRRDFNAASAETRLIALLSPT